MLTIQESKQLHVALFQASTPYNRGSSTIDLERVFSLLREFTDGQVYHGIRHEDKGSETLRRFWVSDDKSEIGVD